MGGFWMKNFLTSTWYRSVLVIIHTDLTVCVAVVSSFICVQTPHRAHLDWTNTGMNEKFHFIPDHFQCICIISLITHSATAFHFISNLTRMCVSYFRGECIILYNTTIKWTNDSYLYCERYLILDRRCFFLIPLLLCVAGECLSLSLYLFRPLL